MAEWLKAHAWKVCIRETVSRVRIPLPPPMAVDFIDVYSMYGVASYLVSYLTMPP
jgi:hypothetical protein